MFLVIPDTHKIKWQIMISANNPFDKEIDIEDNIAVKCDNCGHFTVLKYYYDKDLNIERETAKFYYEIKDEYKKAKYQLENIPFIYKKYRIHPREILITLSSFKMDWITDSINKKKL